MNTSFKNILNRIETRMEPCGTLVITSVQSLKLQAFIINGGERFCDGASEGVAFSFRL